jgi:lysine 2,3-aminomutase
MEMPKVHRKAVRRLVPGSGGGLRDARRDAISLTLPTSPQSDRGEAPPPEPEAGKAALPIGERAERFRARFFPQASPRDWNDWRWQLRHRLRDRAALERIVELSEEELKAIERIGGRLPVGITPYYASLMDPLDPNEPIRRTMIPVGGELVRGPGEALDPLDEDGDSPVPGLVHRYPDRVLFLVTVFCATYCRYCTRARMVGHTGEHHFSNAQYEQALRYIAEHPQIRDVLISGGDPLSLSDDRLDWLLGRLRAIPHVEFVRIGTKIPAVLPQRITPELAAMLRRHHPLWMSLHFMHPDEVTPEVARACERLADAGIPLGSQTVLVRGVNDDVETMKRLVHALLRIRVRPYYLYQCDPIAGSEHLRTPVEKGLEIIAGLRGHTTGYACPTFVVDAPGGGGKIALMPDPLVGRDGDELLLRNYAGEVFRYPSPATGRALAGGSRVP